MASAKNKIKQALIFTALIVTGMYVACFVGLTLAQRHLIYYPCRTAIAAQRRVAAQSNFQMWTNARGEIIGWLRRCQSGEPRLKILLLHGNAGCASDWFHYAEGFQRIEQVEFYILEYPGYGGRSGSPSQTTILRAADDALANIFGSCSIYVVGESLGTGPACYLASKSKTRIGGLFLVAPYNNLADAAQKHLAFFPVKWMLRDRYPSDQWLAAYRGPLAVLLAGRDEVIPSELGQKLFDGYRGRKKLWVEPSATHDDVHRPPARIYREVVEFWNHAAGESDQ